MCADPCCHLPSTGFNVLLCPGLQARLQVAAGRTEAFQRCIAACQDRLGAQLGGVQDGVLVEDTVFVSPAAHAALVLNEKVRRHVKMAYPTVTVQEV